MSKMKVLSKRKTILAKLGEARPIIQAAGLPAVIEAAGSLSAVIQAAGSLSAVIRAAGLPAVIEAAGLPAVIRAAGLPAVIEAAGSLSAVIQAAGLPAVIQAAGSLSAVIQAAGSLSAVIRAVKEKYPEYEEIPKIKNIYSRLWSDIKKKKRVFDQSTYGPKQEREVNICKTPMCTAGNLVSFAGSVGYSMVQKYGFVDTATLIHIKNRSDAPIQNFGAIPDEWALAYIEARALEEENGLPGEDEPQDDDGPTLE